MHEELKVLKENPLATAIFTDLDGTISEIAPTPAEAIITEAMKQVLETLAKHYAQVGIVTGRDAENARRVIGLDTLTYIGNHGLEWIEDGVLSTVADARRFQEQIPTIESEIEQIVQARAVLIEKKSYGIALHYRLADNKTEILDYLDHAIEPVIKKFDFIRLNGRDVIELRPNVNVNKGDAMSAIALAHHIRYVLYLGDDLTDVDAFRALKTLEQEGKISAVTVGVLSDECSPALMQEATFTVGGVPAVYELLRWLVE